jgi:L,D-transpeptidase ErfK/SrfK
MNMFNHPLKNRLPRLSTVLASLGVGVTASGLLFLAAPSIREAGFAVLRTDRGVPRGAAADSSLTKKIRHLEREVADLRKKTGRLAPGRPYLVVNTADNTFTLLNGGDTLRKGICSTGSYTLLKAFDNRQQWIFKTPKGLFHVLQKIESPVWHMPDWAFVEDGKPVPANNAPERNEEGVLGDYALSLGDGYLIHGTLYQRFLGMPVTHGCVRIGDADLKAIFHALELGSEVFIY